MSEKTSDGLFLRWAVVRDLPAVLKIEEHTAGWWTEKEFRHNLQRRNCIIVVAEDAREFLRGFVVYELTDAHTMTVLNCAAMDLTTLRALAARMYEKQDDHQRPCLMWSMANV